MRGSEIKRGHFRRGSELRRAILYLGGMHRGTGWRIVYGWNVRIISAVRCLIKKHFILVCWTKEKDGDLDFRISHKGVELTEAVHRLGVDAVEILQDICDQDSALDEVNDILK